MNGIRQKLFFQIGGLVILLVSIMIIANSLFLETYYINKQKKILLDDYAQINSLSYENYDNHIQELLLIEATTRVDILITSEDNELLYTSNKYITRPMPSNEEEFSKGPPTDINDKSNDNKPLDPPFKIEILEQIDSSNAFLIAKDSKFNINNLVLSGVLDNQDSIEIRIPIASIKANIKLINDFLIIIGFIIFIISLIVAYMISVNFTNPIREMNIATKKLKNLDFSAKCKVYSNDEMGELAENINELSLELSNSISSLNTKNRELNHEIHEKNILDKKRKDLLNNVSHELKTPLTLIQGYAEGLKVNITKSAEKSEFYTDVILGEAKKMNELVETMLSTNHIDSGDLKLDTSRFDIISVIDEVASGFKELIIENNVSLEFDSSKIINVSADKLLIEHVIKNYLTNAIFHSSSPKILKLSTENLGDNIRVNCFNSADLISDEDLSFIWDGFYKVDKARTREKSGHGLGLSIVSSIMSAHNMPFGAMQVEGGIVFWFEVKTI
ncbi:MAG: histidine kinase dimerization/phospho-acceptor domain-containing protein [Acidaminobacteraceae bacterium]